QPNESAVGLAESYGMTPVFETARMYRGPAPKLPLERTFGITTFELG
ncbi:MAG TPA: GNAT family N-acetyltransferase, partial [Kiloniellaceae bacterium]|nr:GNAT family N-acetyltransferase [Kiloniellaceae bacterium]